MKYINYNTNNFYINYLLKCSLPNSMTKGANQKQPCHSEAIETEILRSRKSLGGT